MGKRTYTIKVAGTVQGVGFRPFVYQLAEKLSLCGVVSNGVSGVEIELNATPKQLDLFVLKLRNEAPPLSQIDDIYHNVSEPKIFDSFSIIQSCNKGKRTTLMAPDIAICKECEQELFDPNNRRFHHPFITCTNCGVRYSIIKTLPYDRENSSMSDFKMCKECNEEYTNPSNRRYHAQPIGCHNCGPKLTMAVDEAVQHLSNGKILAIKGVGGYHLVCDATNDEAVKKMRERKKRPSKPYALMIRDINKAKDLAIISKKEEHMLLSKERPIVLLKMKKEINVSKKVAPNITKIGLFLPYTPLHLLLLEKFQKPIVATSANITDEPICTTLESLKKLEGVYDYILDHDREIINGCDDSVLMIVKEQTIMIRRARGFAPASIRLPFKLSNKVLALGANQKSTIAIGFDKEVILSPHIGDLDTLELLEYFEKNIQTLKRVYDFNPDIVACDKHPNYESTKYALSHYPKIKTVQHHYAHILGVMAEKQLNTKVLGVSFDGTGYGDDGNLWGGEFLICDFKGYERVAHMSYFKLLGGAKAIKEPKRVALSLLFDLYGKKVLDMQNPTIQAFSQLELNRYFIAWEKGLNSPLSSSIGRIFDAVASLTGVCQVMSFEGESGMLLEELYDSNVCERYHLAYDNKCIDFLPMIKEIFLENDKKVAVSKFFNTLVDMIFTIHKQYDLPLVLSGGVFQNRVLLELVLEKIPDAIFPNEIPPNDGGIALGQIVAQNYLDKKG